jgi:hypothetical protein
MKPFGTNPQRSEARMVSFALWSRPRTMRGLPEVWRAYFFTESSLMRNYILMPKMVRHQEAKDRQISEVIATSGF